MWLYKLIETWNFDGDQNLGTNHFQKKSVP